MDNICSPDCCCGPDPACATTITVRLVDMLGTNNRFCPCPAELDYSITGSPSSGAAFKPIVGKTNVCADFVLNLPVAMLPEGRYSIRVYEVGQACPPLVLNPGPAAPTGRFDATVAFVAACPKTAVTVVVREQWQLAIVASNFAISSCRDSRDASPLPPFSVDAATGGGATECGRTTKYANGATIPNSGIVVALRVTAYPYSVTFTGSGADYFTATETRTGTACGVTTSDWSRQPFTWYRKYAIAATGCPSCNPGGQSNVSAQPLAGATVDISGGVTGTGTTDDTGRGIAYLSAYEQDKDGAHPERLLRSWTVTADRFVGASYDESAYLQALRRGTYYGGSICPAGGSPGATAAGFHCGGCPVPAMDTLQASVLGGSLTLVNDGRDWKGRTTVQMLSKTCDTFDPRNPVRITTGPVAIFVEFLCLANPGTGTGRPYVNIWHRANSLGEPCQCDGSTSNPISQPQLWQTFSGVPNYSARLSASCSPFAGEFDDTVVYGLTRLDGSNIVDYYDLELDFTVSE